MLAVRVGKGLNERCHQGQKVYQMGLSHLKHIALYYFNLKRKEAAKDVLNAVLKHLWCETYEQILPVLNNADRLNNKIQSGIYWPIRRAMEQLCWQGGALMQQIHEYLFEGVVNTSINSLHAYEVGGFNKGKLNKGLQFGRAFQLGRIGGNFLVVGQFTTLYMPDAPSLPAMLQLHQNLFGAGVLLSIATDKGYYSYDNEQLLIKTGVAAIQLPRPERTLNAPPETTPWSIRQELHDRRSGIEPLIGHTKHGRQMGRSRMKSDETTKIAGYAAVFGFNIRQLTRYLMGEVRSKNDETVAQSANEAQIDRKLFMIPQVG